MLLTRVVDERMWILSRQGKAHFVITGRGHEAAQVGSAFALRAGHDVVFTYYRSLGVAIALGMPCRDLFLGVLGKAADPVSGARQLPSHFTSRSLRMPSPSSSVSTQIPHAAGAAWAARVLGQDFVTICYFGDGATSKGDFHEALNVSGVHKLPVVFFCENNGLSISVPLREQMPTATVAERASAYGMPGVRVDGLDPFAVYQATRTAVDRARAGNGPSLIEATVVRMTPHSSDDDDRYRSDEDRSVALAQDPLPKTQARLESAGIVAAGESESWLRQLREEVLADQDWADAHPVPEPSRARRWLFRED